MHGLLDTDGYYRCPSCAVPVWFHGDARRISVDLLRPGYREYPFYNLFDTIQHREYSSNNTSLLGQRRPIPSVLFFRLGIPLPPQRERPQPNHQRQG